MNTSHKNRLERLRQAVDLLTKQNGEVTANQDSYGAAAISASEIITTQAVREANVTVQELWKMAYVLGDWVQENWGRRVLNIVLQRLLESGMEKLPVHPKGLSPLVKCLSKVIRYNDCPAIPPTINGIAKRIIQLNFADFNKLELVDLVEGLSKVVGRADCQHVPFAIIHITAHIAQLNNLTDFNSQQKMANLNKVSEMIGGVDCRNVPLQGRDLRQSMASYVQKKDVGRLPPLLGCLGACCARLSLPRYDTFD